MTVDFLSDAMNEISDKHIAEAACYEPKAKRISFKKIIFIAACFVVIAITALYVNTFLSKPSVKQDETTSSAIETTKDDIFSDSSTNTTVGTTASSGVPIGKTKACLGIFILLLLRAKLIRDAPHIANLSKAISFYRK